MDYPISHYFLVRSRSGQLAGQHVERYLANNQLISYAEFFVRTEEILNGAGHTFWDTLGHGLAANDQFARRMLAHLKEEGVTSLDQLPELEQGYVTKILHTLTHLLDGFIGIDSVFYNLVEDSHRVSAGLSDAIRANPADYWLVPVRTGKLEASVLHPVD
ncbi:hypothetical protein Despr_0955 [Desulfobulbus propionicus DSM 2032]|jgi:hypothetical protein|uniref:Uncharacterized protein n=1 Tax=Desulfobulbus propionicus (strain ATCC 33891 / DSM 2032 / VKM B-1956 / 1pr3) TaxID=577650 RepID=A0A7U3YKL3_DESPD|nr:hypothetical protein [Desulfobulbus propionicus]ADW17129.1 hypothetical protein Despr_0955 [Desulfobulbus propionicus DSM 2032]